MTDELTAKQAEFSAASIEVIEAGFAAADQLEKMMAAMQTLAQMHDQVCAALARASVAYARQARATAAMVGMEIPEKIRTH
ncbi:MAG TPA: hypothetical protein VIJ59_00215 [Caulobacteraceae bacterium]